MDGGEEPGGGLEAAGKALMMRTITRAKVGGKGRFLEGKSSATPRCSHQQILCLHTRAVWDKKLMGSRRNTTDVSLQSLLGRGVVEAADSTEMHAEVETLKVLRNY